MSKPLNPKQIPQLLPAKIPPPLFSLGTNVCWNSVSYEDPDCGLILGMRYIWSRHIQDWRYQYYIALNTDSPSYQWAKFDWGWQEDLTLVLASEARLNSKEKND